MAMKGYPYFPKLQHNWSHTITLFHIISRTFIREVLPLGRDAVGVFYSPSWLGHSLTECYPLAEMQSVYSAAPANWAKDLIKCYGSRPSGPVSDSNEKVLCIPQSSSITGTWSWDCLVSYPGHLLEGVLPLCRDAIGILYSPSRLGYLLGNFTPLQRCRSCILQPQLIGPLVDGVLPLCRDAVGVFCS